MLLPTSRFEYVPYEDADPAWYGRPADKFNPKFNDEILPDDDPVIIRYVSEMHGADIERIRPALLDELALSVVPYSGMHTACALQTWAPHSYPHESHIYFGHREEQLAETGEFHVVTAVEMALGKVATEAERVSGVYLTGHDLPDGKLKRMMPIPTDYDHLAKRFGCDWGPTFIIIPPDSYGWPALQGLRWVWASRHAKAYAQHERIVLSQLADDEEPDMRRGYIRDRLLMKTSLTPKDMAFVVDFTEAAIRNNWTAFFTGSASGLGEITPAITDEYDDMDFIVVANQQADAEASIIALAESHYGPLIKIPEVAYDTYGGKKIKGFFLYDQAGNKRIQLAVGKTMDEVCFRPDVIERNSGIWMHESREWRRQRASERSSNW